MTCQVLTHKKIAPCVAPCLSVEVGSDESINPEASCLAAAHCKSSMFGCSLNIPITGGRFNLGTWQVSASLALSSLCLRSPGLTLAFSHTGYLDM